MSRNRIVTELSDSGTEVATQSIVMNAQAVVRTRVQSPVPAPTVHKENKARCDDLCLYITVGKQRHEDP